MENQRLIPQECKLYAVNVAELVSNRDAYTAFFQRLAEVTNGAINLDSLTLVATERRHLLYVLLGPVQNWSADGDGPKIYSVIEAYLEGKIEGIPDLDDTEVGEVARNFLFNPKVVQFVGAKIMNVYVQEQPYGRAALQLLERYCNGGAAEDAYEQVPHLGAVLTQLQRRNLAIMHYLRVVIDPPSLGQYEHWEANGFSISYFGKLEDETPVVCIMSKWLNDYDTDIPPKYRTMLSFDYYYIFKSQLKRGLRYVDHSFALRILDKNLASRSTILKYKPWDDLDGRLITAFIGGGRHLRERISYIMTTVAELYFDGHLPLQFSESERCMLVLYGLQMRTIDEIMGVMNLSEEGIYQMWKGIFEKASDHVYGLFPEVVDE